jgi:hypothetical protein
VGFSGGECIIAQMSSARIAKGTTTLIEKPIKQPFAKSSFIFISFLDKLKLAK